ncbi:MAG: 23S rRNA (pseudouridine(1915)-N(3))-methyltransferase RlmH [Rickettsiales bacterium]|nr:23S rRNA (pseudouridine(1915)-N(3))-methyltransferase RlmH [Rickettsiales bacterium]
MRLLIATTGKWKHSPERALWDHYVQRMPWECTLKELPALAAAHPQEQRMRETEALILCAKQWGAQKLIFLDETGKALTSEAFAAQMGRWRDDGDRSFAFLIGGDHGHDKNRLPEGQLTLALGTMTWPHLLVRALLAEQIYRVHAILTGHPYHRN